MDEAAPITWLINQINLIVANGAGAAAGAIAGVIAPLVSVCFGIYIILIIFNYLRGAESEPVLDFFLRCASFAAVIGFGLNADTYTSTIMPIVTGLGTDLANAVGGGTDTANSMDQLALFYLKIINDSFAAVELMSGFDKMANYIIVGLKTVIILLGLIPFLVAAAISMVIANVGSVLVAMVGPIFISCLLFPATRQYFSSWVNTAFSYALIPLFVAVIATISIGISRKMLGDASGTLVEAKFASVFLAAIGNLILLFLLNQVSSLASSLSAGGVNVAMPGSVGTLASSIRGSIRGSRKDVKGMANDARGIRDFGRKMTDSIANKKNSIRKAG